MDIWLTWVSIPTRVYWGTSRRRIVTPCFTSSRAVSGSISTSEHTIEKKIGVSIPLVLSKKMMGVARWFLRWSGSLLRVRNKRRQWTGKFLIWRPEASRNYLYSYFQIKISTELFANGSFFFFFFFFSFQYWLWVWDFSLLSIPYFK